MIVRDFLNLVRRKKSGKEKAQAAYMFAVVIGVAAAAGAAAGIIFAARSGRRTWEDLEGKALESAESAKKTAAQASRKIHSEISAVREKTDAVKRDIKDGLQEIKQDTGIIVENVLNDLNKPVE